MVLMQKHAHRPRVRKCSEMYLCVFMHLGVSVPGVWKEDTTSQWGQGEFLRR